MPRNVIRSRSAATSDASDARCVVTFHCLSYSLRPRLDDTSRDAFIHQETNTTKLTHFLRLSPLFIHAIFMLHTGTHLLSCWATDENPSLQFPSSTRHTFTITPTKLLEVSNQRIRADRAHFTISSLSKIVVSLKLETNNYL